MSALEVKDVRASYATVQALTGVSFTLEEGRICGLVGQNGSGKSTLMKSIMGSVAASGSVRIMDTEPEKARKAGLVGYVPQNEGVDWAFPVSVHDVVMMGRYGFMGMMRRPKKEDHEAVQHALDMVEMSQYSGRQIGSLSGGQRKRVFIARAIAQGAKLMLLDEPFAGVDKPSEAMITRLLRTLSSQGVAILVATHDLGGLDVLCDEVLLLNRRVIFHGSVAEATRPEIIVQAFGGSADAAEATAHAEVSGVNIEAFEQHRGVVNSAENGVKNGIENAVQNATHNSPQGDAQISAQNATQNSQQGDAQISAQNATHNSPKNGEEN
ncbi:metal ABC transporter ATP-binding protein [Actinotignum urinale]|uniref:metal ABC transporter ATP-binding protein n=1 Tax=Actinotignum urinale TaxID=190146 RepID=UPI00370DADAC